MPSTYTGSNGIEKMGIGEDENSWGQRLNNNFDLIDQSLDGYAFIVLTTTSLTLSIPNGTASTGRCRVIRFSGSPSGPVTVTLPVISKMFWVGNSSNQPVTLTVGGGSNVVLAAGDARPIFVDAGGSAVLDMLAYQGTVRLPGLHVDGNASVTGDLTGNHVIGVQVSATAGVDAPSFSGTNISLSNGATIVGAIAAGSQHIFGNSIIDGQAQSGTVVSGAANFSGAVSTAALTSSSVSAPTVVGTTSVTSPIGNITTVNSNTVNASDVVSTAVHTALLSSSGNIQAAANVSGATLIGNTANIAGTAFVNELNYRGSLLTSVISGMLSSISAINGSVVLSGVSPEGTSNGGWIKFDFGTIVGTRVQIAFGKGECSNGETIALPSGHSASNMTAVSFINNVSSGSPALGLLFTQVDSAGVVSISAATATGVPLSAGAGWFAVSYRQGY